MAGKIRAALIRKEADTYRSQGLHREARELYAQLLNSTSNINPQTEEAVRRQIEQIRAAEHEAGDAQERRKLSVELLDILKSGWGDKPTESDYLVCAHALMELGCFAEALEEFRPLAGMDTAAEDILEPVAACLIRLNPPGARAAAAERWAGPPSTGSGAIEAFRRALIARLEPEDGPGAGGPGASEPADRPPDPWPGRGLGRLWRRLKKMLTRDE
jgi:hypothetical protein